MSNPNKVMGICRDRVTQYWYTRPLTNRFAWWLYEKWCNEPYIPKGKIEYTFDKNLNCIKIRFIPDRFIPGSHVAYIPLEYIQGTKEDLQIINNHLNKNEQQNKESSKSSR